MSSIPTDGLIFHDSFNGDTADTGQTRTVTGGAAIYSDTISGIRILRVPGSSSMAYPTDNLPIGNAARTMCAWARAFSPATFYANILSYGTPATGQGPGFGHHTNGRGFLGLYGNDFFTENNIVDQQKWSFLLMTLEPAASGRVNAKLYIDNAPVIDAQSAAANTVIGGYPLRVGQAMNAGSSDAFNGEIMAPRIYNRVLDEFERTALYQEFENTVEPAFQPLALIPSGIVPVVGVPGVLFGNIFIPAATL